MSKIPIKNIYYMLSYAYDSLKQGDNVNLSQEEFDNVFDLFAKILVNGVSMLIKRGFNREYISVTDELTVMRGKIDVTETLKRQNYTLGKLSCEFDELSSNILFNQIIKATIITLIKYKELDKNIHQKLINIYRYFEGIQTIKLEKAHFYRIRYHRNNSFYKLIIDICELLYDEAIVTSEKGETTFKDFMRGKAMANLYEKFILKFFEKELISYYPFLKVHSPHIKWQKDLDFESDCEDLLPIMRTDIVIETKPSQLMQKRLIIDAKYYANALQTRNVGDSKKLISTNLYQIYAYINNSEFAGEKSGMLIYPVVDTNLDLVYSIQGKKIYVKTLNLNENWEKIRERLIEIAGVIYV